MHKRQTLGTFVVAAAVLCSTGTSGLGQPSRNGAQPGFQAFRAVTSDRAWVWSSRHLWLVDAATDSWKAVKPPAAFALFPPVSAGAVSEWFKDVSRGILIWISGTSCDETGQSPNAQCRTVLRSATTEDAGVNWRSSEDMLSDNPRLSHIEQADFLNINSGWLVLGAEPGAGQQPRTLLWTGDSGRSWQVLSSCSSPAQKNGISCENSAQALAFGSQTEGWLVKCHLYGGPPEQIQLLRSRDGGKTWNDETERLQQTVWQQRNPPVPGELSRIFVGGQHRDQLVFSALYSRVEAPGDIQSLIFRTEDAGSTWKTFEPPKTSKSGDELPGLSVFSGNFAIQPYCLGQPSRCTAHMLLSKDGGHTWNDVFSRLPLRLGSLTPGIGVVGLEHVGAGLWLYLRNSSVSDVDAPGKLLWSGDEGQHWRLL